MGRRWRAKVRTSGKPCLSILMWQMTVRRRLLPVYSGCKTESLRVVHFGFFDLGRFALVSYFELCFHWWFCFGDASAAFSSYFRIHRLIQRACNSSLSEAIKHLSTRPCHVKKSQWTVSDWLLQFMLHDVGDFPACFFPSELPMLPGITALLAALRGIGWALVMAMSWGLKGLEVDSKKLGSKSPGLLALGCWFFSGTPGRESTSWMNLRSTKGHGFCCKSPKFVSGFLRASHPGTVASRVCLWGSEKSDATPQRVD